MNNERGMSDHSRVGDSKHSHVSESASRRTPATKSLPTKGKGGRTDGKKASVVVFIGHS